MIKATDLYGNDAMPVFEGIAGALISTPSQLRSLSITIKSNNTVLPPIYGDLFVNMKHLKRLFLRVIGFEAKENTDTCLRLAKSFSKLINL